MRVLILSSNGQSAGLAYRLMQEGHSVDFWIADKDYDDVLRGYVQRPVSWRPLVAFADLVICDSPEYSEHEPLFKRLGKPVLCCNPVSDILSSNKVKSIEAFRKLDIQTIPTQIFNTPVDAATLKWDNASGYIVKPLQGNGKTFLCTDIALYMWALSTYSLTTPISVQIAVNPADSIYITTEGWFNGIDWIHPFIHTFEDTFGCVTLTVDTPNKLVQSTIARFTPLLVRIGYRGPISIKCIANEGNVYATDILCGFQFDTLEAIMTGLNEPVGAFLFDTATGVKKSINVRQDFLITSQIIHTAHEDKGMPICGLTDTDMKFTYLCDVFRGDNNQVCYAASTGTILKATAFGRSVKEVQHRVSKICKNIKTINNTYNPYIGERVDRDLSLLRKWGWI